MHNSDDILSSIESFKKWLKTRKEGFADTVRFLAARAHVLDKEINAFIRINTDSAVKRALFLEKNAERGPLWGVPIGVKDNLCVKGELATCASRILEGFRPPYNATAVEKLLDNGALLMGSTNMDEFAFGSSCETSCYGPTKNPWDLTKIPGGSSGGSAASVAAGEVVAAIGSDTGGSIRQPASMCGVVGLKPTYGLVSRYGLIAFASSLDQIGHITRNVTDCAAILEVIAGYDPLDSTSVKGEVVSYTKYLTDKITGLVIGIPKECFTLEMAGEVKACIEKAIEVYKKMGAVIVEISLPHLKYAVSCYYIIAPAEASSNLARYDGVHYGYRSKKDTDFIEMCTSSRTEAFGREVKRRILLGTYSLSSGYYEDYYLKAQKVRTKISGDFLNAFKTCDCILTPTCPTTAFKIGEKTHDPLTMYLSDIFTIPVNLAGLPAISIPAGNDRDNLPVGLQLIAAPFNEVTLLKTAYAFEQNTFNLVKRY